MTSLADGVDRGAIRRSAIGIGCAAAAILAVVVGTGLLITRTPAGTAVVTGDLALLDALGRHRTLALDELSVWGTHLASTEVVIGVGVFAGLAGSVLVRHWWPMLLMVLSVGGETQLFVWASLLVGRARPPLPRLDGVLPPTSSFPSGHTAAAICLYGGIAAMVLLATSRWWRWPVLGIAFIAVVVVALSRLYRIAHHPSDILGSLLLGIPWATAVALVIAHATTAIGTDPRAWIPSIGSP
jgi:undecaprenyl-diphosphatase